MGQIIPKYIKLQEVSNEHSVEVPQIQGKFHQTVTAPLHSPFHIKGTKNKASFQPDIITKLTSVLYHRMRYKGAEQR